MLATPVAAQGFVIFKNSEPSIDFSAPVFNGLSGVDWHRPETVVQLYVGPLDIVDAWNHPEAFRPVGEPVPLGFEGQEAGYWGVSDNIVLEIPNSAPGDSVRLEVRGWELRLGSTFEEAASVIGENLLVGRSNNFPLTLGSVEEPALLDGDGPPRPGLLSFGLFPTLPIPEPATSASMLLGCLVILWRGCLRKD